MARKLLAIRFTRSSPDIEKVHSTKPQKTYGSTYAPISTRNRAQSPLLRLPCEVRRIIWRCLLGDNVIHLIDTDLLSVIPGHVICGVDGDSTTSHNKCLGHVYCTPVAPEYKHCKDCTISFNLRQLDLRVLRICSDIYIGATEVLMSTNTFYFDYNFRSNVLSRLWGVRYSTAMKRVRLTLPVNWRFSTELGRIRDVTKTLKSCLDLQIDIHQNSWIPDYYTSQYWLGTKPHDRMFAQLNEFRESFGFDNLEVLRYSDSSFGPETLPATCRYQYGPTQLANVGQLEKLLQWSHHDASLVNRYLKNMVTGELALDTSVGQDQKSAQWSPPECPKPNPLALVGYLGGSKDDFRMQLTAYWKFVRDMPLKRPHK